MQPRAQNAENQRFGHACAKPRQPKAQPGQNRGEYLARNRGGGGQPCAHRTRLVQARPRASATRPASRGQRPQGSAPSQRDHGKTREWQKQMAARTVSSPARQPGATAPWQVCLPGHHPALCPGCSVHQTVAPWVSLRPVRHKASGPPTAHKRFSATLSSS